MAKLFEIESGLISSGVHGFCAAPLLLLKLLAACVWCWRRHEAAMH